MRRSLVALSLATALGVGGLAFAQAREAEPATETPPASEAAKPTPPSGAEAAPKPAPGAQPRDTFEPPDKIRADSSVSFPVDI